MDEERGRGEEEGGVVTTLMGSLARSLCERY